MHTVRHNKQTVTNNLDCQRFCYLTLCYNAQQFNSQTKQCNLEAAVWYRPTAKLWRQPTWKSADFFRTLAPILALSQLSCSTVFFRRWRAASAWATASWTVGTLPPAGATAAERSRVYCVRHSDLQPVKRQLICIEQQCIVDQHGALLFL